jgi:hypothetical protein
MHKLKTDDFPWKPWQVRNDVAISCQTRSFATKTIFFDDLKRVGLLFSADGNTIIFAHFDRPA